MESPASSDATASHSVRISIFHGFSPMLPLVDCLKIDKNAGVLFIVASVYDMIVLFVVCDCSRVYLFF